MKRRLQFTGEIEFTYDPESPEFKGALSSYKHLVFRNGGESDMLNYVANWIMFRSLVPPVEGVGFVEPKNTHHVFVRTPFSGIFVAEGYDDIEYETLELKEGGENVRHM